MKRHVLIELRPSIADDFKTETGFPNWGVVFFKQSCTGTIERKINYLSQENANDEFKQLFESGQIWVLQNPNECTSTCVEPEAIETVFELVSTETELILKN